MVLLLFLISFPWVRKIRLSVYKFDALLSFEIMEMGATIEWACGKANPWTRENIRPRISHETLVNRFLIILHIMLLPRLIY